MKSSENPNRTLQIFHTALNNVKLKLKCAPPVGGATYQVPMEVRGE